MSTKEASEFVRGAFFEGEAGGRESGDVLFEGVYPVVEVLSCWGLEFVYSICCSDLKEVFLFVEDGDLCSSNIDFSFELFKVIIFHCIP